MGKKIVIVLSGLLFGIGLGYLLLLFSPLLLVTPHSIATVAQPSVHMPVNSTQSQHEVIGFLPFWLTGKAQADYADYITTLAYFALTVDTDGKILKLTSPVEEDPGWFSLQSGKLDSFFATAKKKNVHLSLTVFNGNNDDIADLMTHPEEHARNLVSDVIPVMKKFGFSDLNLDIENTKEATGDAQQRFTRFASELKKGLIAAHAGTLTIEMSPTDLIRHDLISAKDIASIADKIVIMAYDYHYAGSSVTGPVAPLSGAGVVSEYDTQAAIEKAHEVIPAEKTILGIPLYGYEWETLTADPRSAVIPGTGVTASSARADTLAQSCKECSLKRDSVADEAYLIYKDPDTGTYHQIFYPDSKATQTKISFVKENNLGGLALWALGYEDTSILEPLKEYIK